MVAVLLGQHAGGGVPRWFSVAIALHVVVRMGREGVPSSYCFLFFCYIVQRFFSIVRLQLSSPHMSHSMT